MDSLQQLKGWSLEGRSLILDAGPSGRVRLTPVAPLILRVSLERSFHRHQGLASVTVTEQAWPAMAPPVVSERAGHLLVWAAGFGVRVEKDRVRLRYWLAGEGEEPRGRHLLAESAEAGIFHDGWTVGVRFDLEPDDRFLGLGEPDQREGPIPLDHRGRRYPVWNRHQPPPSRLVLPVLVNPRGYGLFIDNTWPAEWDLGSDEAHVEYRAQGGDLTLYLIGGPQPAAVLDRLTWLTGRPSLPPRWTLGLLQSKFGYRNRQEVEELVATFREKQIPLDGIVLDLYWFRRMGDLSFDRAAFPDPAGLIGWLREQGIRLVLIEEPYVVTDSRLFAEGKRLGLFGKRSDGTPYLLPFWSWEAALVDFTDPQARQWWADQHRPLLDLGVAGWWTDLNEPEEHPIDMLHAGGSAPAVHNRFALHMAQAVALACQQHRPDDRPFIMSRSGWPGVQALGAHLWSGDVETTWEALANQIPLGLSMGMAGMPFWNSDIGGYGGAPPSPELYVRWMQFGAFTPVMRPHGAHQSREPWAFDPQAEAIATEYIRLRYRLAPYNYTCAREASTSGMPLMRPLGLQAPADPEAWAQRDAYLWGPDLLVAPVVEPGATSRQVYLPDGVWYDFWTQGRVQGGQVATVSAPLERLPLFVRAGAILPLAPEQRRCGDDWQDLTLCVYPGEGRSTGALYEDDGESRAHERGEYAITPFACEARAGGWEVTIGAPEGSYPRMRSRRRFRLEVRLDQGPGRVWCGDEPLLPGPEGGEGPGWWYDGEALLLHVNLGLVAGPVRVRVEREV